MSYKSKQLYGHDPAKQFFLKAFREGVLPCSWLIYGSPGIGKSLFTLDIIKSLLSDTDSNSTDVIASKIEASSHPDSMLIDAYTKDGEVKSQPLITVDEIRKVSKFLRLTACESKYKIVMIKGAQHLNINASNALLKLLEEPPKDSYIFLVTNSIAKIIPTIRSRCAMLNLKDLSYQDFSSVVKINIDLIDDYECEKLYELSNGNVKFAIDMYKNLPLVEQFKQLMQSQVISKIVSFCENVKLIQDNWLILKFMMINEVICSIKRNLDFVNLDTIERIDYLNNLQSYLSDIEIYHLDKPQFILSFLTSFKP